MAKREDVCPNHTDRPATTRCHQCHKPACEECTVVTEDGRFCSTQCARAYADFREAGKGAAKPGRSKLRLIAGAILLLAVLLVVGAKVLNIEVCKKILDSLVP